ncbi:hypothetical protein [Absidia glauca]|uniref:Uncharacterized protein n=1 Tax=Absidia glauca TaxID=4829 RepID=A0A163J1K5_ABSGL|nr:hypothetical protein [Absidia glauca]
MALKNVPLTNMTQCLEAWATWNGKGATVLSSIDVNDPKSNDLILSELTTILSGMRQALDAMHERFDGVPKDDAQFGLYRQCIHMFDQEFMVKESIHSIVKESGFMSKQQLTGSISLWKAEAYLDEDVIKQLH